MGLLFFLLKQEQLTELVGLASQDEAGTHLRDFAVEHRFVVFVVEEVDVASGTVVQAVFDADVVDERLSGVLRILARADLPPTMTLMRLPQKRLAKRKL